MPTAGARTATFIIIALMIAEFTSAFELTMVYAAMKTFFAVFRNPALVGWLITSYLLISAASAAICGKLGDMFGRKRVLLIVLAGALFGSLISATSSDLHWIIAGRAIQGLAGAVLPLCFGIARQTLPVERVPYGVSAIGSTAVIASGLGILLGGIIVEHLQWHGIFYASASFALFSILAVAVVVPGRQVCGGAKRIDLLGGLLFVPAIFALLLVASNGAKWGWTTPTVLATGFGGALLFGIWVYHELTTAFPLINLRLLANRNLALANLCMALYGLGPLQAQLQIMIMQQPRWTGIGVGLSPTLAGLYTLPGQLTALFVAPITGFLCKRYGGRFATIVGAITICISAIVILLFPSSLWIIVCCAPIAGFGSTVIYAAIPNVVVAASPAANTAESTGVTQVCRSASQAVGAQIVGTILASATVTGVGASGVFPAPAAIVGALSFVALASIAMLVVAILLPRRPVNIARLDHDDTPLAPANAVA